MFVILTQILYYLLEEGAMKQKLKKMAEQFVEETSHAGGLEEIAIVREIAMDSEDPYGLELAVVISDFADFHIISRAARRLTNISNHWLVFVFDMQGEFKGEICFRKECPGGSIDCYHPKCGEIPNVMWNPNFIFQKTRMFSKPLKVIFSRKSSHFLAWQKEVLAELDLKEPVSEDIMEEITLTCSDCEKEFIWTVESQLLFEEKGWDPPKRCPGCRPAKCLRCGMRLRLTCSEAENRDIEFCETCLEEMSQEPE